LPALSLSLSGCRRGSAKAKEGYHSRFVKGGKRAEEGLVAAGKRRWQKARKARKEEEDVVEEEEEKSERKNPSGEKNQKSENRKEKRYIFPFIHCTD
jgi:hypothetical protein